MAPEKLIVGVLALIMLSALGFSTAPAWVAKGVNLNYTAGTDTVTFTVTDRNAEYVKFDIKYASQSSSISPSQNASGEFGDFWHDPDKFYSSSEYLVKDESKMTFAGKEWDTMTLEGTVSGFTITKIYDKATGLMLKQTVDAPGAQVITLKQWYIPSISPPPEQPPSQPPQPPANQTPPPQPPANGSQQPPSVPGQPYVPSQPSGPGETPAAPEIEEEGKKPITELCCPSAAILLMVGFASIRHGRVR